MNETMRKRDAIDAAGAEPPALTITASCSVALSGGVIASLIYLLLALASWMAVPPAFAQSAPVSAGVRLEAGIEKEDVDGDLTSAMDIYQKIAADKSAPRDVRAKALLRLAGCDEKLGHQARQVYEQIVHDYSDLPAAAQARRRLALITRQEHPAPLPTMTARKIEWSKLGGVGTTDTDGERAVYSDLSGKLFYGDLAGRSRRLILTSEHFGWIPCRDFSMVILDLLATATRPHTLAVINTDGSGYRELIRDDASNSIFGENRSMAMSCSWDDRAVLLSDFSLRTTLAGQLWIVSVSDGRRSVLADAEGGRVRKAVFSPDGRFAAYEVWQIDSTSPQNSRVFVVPIHGGKPRLVFESSPWQVGNSFISLMDWTADGHNLAIRDIRHGSSALYMLPIKDGVENGSATFIRFGDFDEGYTTAAGALVYEDLRATPVIHDFSLGSIGADGRIDEWRRLELNSSGGTLYDNPHPSFSPDGNQIGYIARDADRAGRDLIVRDLKTGRERVIYQSFYGGLGCQFSARGPNVFCTVEKERAETDLISVAAEAGTVEKMATLAGSRFLLLPSQDDQTFFFSSGAWTLGPHIPPIILWDRTTQHETVIEPAPEIQAFEQPSVDGRSLVRTQDHTVSIRSITGVDWRPLASGDILPYPPYVPPDGKWVWYQARDAAGKPGLYRVLTGGGTPERLGDLPNRNSGGAFFFSRDGRQVLAMSSSFTNYDLWVLENFVPSAKK